MEKNRNREIVNCFYKAIASGNLAGARKLLHRDIEWVESESTGFWIGGTYRGACAVFSEVILPAYGWIVGFRVEIDQYLSLGEHVAAMGRFRGLTKTTGKELNAPTTHVWTLRDGKAVRVHAYHAQANWLEALDSSNPELAQVAA
jgi:ketosteroid isomerase-like protein